MGGVQEQFEVAQGSVARIDIDIVRDVVAVISQGRREEWKQPQAGDAEVLKIIESRDEPGEVPDAIAIGVLKSADVKFVDYSVFKPEGIGCATGFLHSDDLSYTLQKREQDALLTSQLHITLNVIRCAGWSFRLLHPL